MKAIILAVFCVVWAHQSHQHHNEGYKIAEATVLTAGEQKEVGKLILHYDGKITMISGHVKGLTPGKHGFHIHEKGDLSNKCYGTGPHFNPDNKHHGAPTDEDRHVGDLGDIEAGPDGVAKVNILDKIIALDGPHNIINRAVVVHAKGDDFDKRKREDRPFAGHAGPKVACGIIRELHH